MIGGAGLALLAPSSIFDGVCLFFGVNEVNPQVKFVSRSDIIAGCGICKLLLLSFVFLGLFTGLLTLEETREALMKIFFHSSLCLLRHYQRGV